MWTGLRFAARHKQPGWEWANFLSRNKKKRSNPKSVAQPDLVLGQGSGEKKKDPVVGSGVGQMKNQVGIFFGPIQTWPDRTNDQV